MSEDTCSDLILPIMEELGYTCFNRGKFFAQFDSELGIFGSLDFLFVSTAEGKKIIKRSVLFSDELFGSCPVVQPVDYIGLKLMDIANNQIRASRDTGDIIELLQIIKKGPILWNRAVTVLHALTNEKG
jgi:hypothetical protein